MTIDVKLMVVLTKFNNVFISKLGKNLEMLGMPGSTYPILAHLNIVGKEKTQKLGEVSLITSGTITHVVSKMIAKGYVEKFKDEVDKRVYWVKITQQGREAYKKVEHQHMKYLGSLLEDFNDAEKDELINQLKLFGKNMSKKEIDVSGLVKK